MEENKRARLGGIPANLLFVPLIVIIAVLQISASFLTAEVDRSNNELSELVMNSGTYQREATNLQIGINVLSETASNYVQNPVVGDGTPNVGPLKAYLKELGTDRRGAAIRERLKNCEISDEAMACVEDAAEVSEQMLSIQLRAISLLDSVYPLPDIPELAALPKVELTEEELDMPEEARIGLARQMILSQDYAKLKYAIAEDVENCHKVLERDFSIRFDQVSRHTHQMRTALRSVGVAAILLMAGVSLLLFFSIIRPLRRYSLLITTDRKLPDNSAIRELRLLSSAYNALLLRRDKLEGILRNSAEKDALTGLANRLCLERYVLDAGSGGSMAVLLLDVNYLKRVNDEKGHLSGDQLLRSAASCIRECFASGSSDNCFRIGGDEFVVVLRDCDEEEVKKRIGRFDLTTRRENISVSVGYAYTAEFRDNSFKTLMAAADKRMYEQKKRLHENSVA